MTRWLYWHFDTASGTLSGGGTDIFCYSLLRFFTMHRDRIDLTIKTLVPAAQPTRIGTIIRLKFLWKLLADYGSWLFSNSDVYVFVYPKLPVVAFTDDTRLINITEMLWRLWARGAKFRGQKIVIVVEDLPQEQGFSATIPPAATEVSPPNRLERTVFQQADRLISPSARFSAYIAKKHQIRADRFLLFRRNIYIPPPSSTSPESVQLGAGVNVFYSGGIDHRLSEVFKQIFQIFATTPQANLWICGHGGERVRAWIATSSAQNVHHLGVLDHGTHDAVAQQCDFGLLLYPRSTYNDMTPTMKYTGYAANGLAILSTDLATVAENLQQDEIGLALPFAELPAELDRWLTDPSRFAMYRVPAKSVKKRIRNGSYMQEWLDVVLGEDGETKKGDRSEHVKVIS